MNFHPLLVHFPIAFLSIYAVLEFVRWKKIAQTAGWFYTKAGLAIFGTLATYVAYASGDGRTFRGSPIFRLHTDWAAATVAVFTFIGAYYLIEALKNNPAYIDPWIKRLGLSKVWSFIVAVQAVLGKPAVLVCLAIAGLVCVAITGALGGSLIYGPNVDPLVSFVYKLIVH